jgi:hypothetical protein
MTALDQVAHVLADGASPKPHRAEAQEIIAEAEDVFEWRHGFPPWPAQTLRLAKLLAAERVRRRPPPFRLL